MVIKPFAVVLVGVYVYVCGEGCLYAIVFFLGAFDYQNGCSQQRHYIINSRVKLVHLRRTEF